MTRKEKVPPCPENGQGAAPPCPPWCNRLHLGEGIRDGVFHHDSPLMSLYPSAPSTEDLDPELMVNVCQRVEGDQAGPVQVELQGDRSVALLSPAEARELARMLTEAAGTAACQPWCTEHLTETDACSTNTVEADVAGGISMWASQTPADPAALVSVDGHNAEGLAFELLLTLEQACALATSLLQLGEATDRG